MKTKKNIKRNTNFNKNAHNDFESDLKINNKDSFVGYYFLIAAFIIIIFGLIYGFRILNPTNIDWIFVKSDDITQHYVGWESFRAGHWTFPFG